MQTWTAQELVRVFGVMFLRSLQACTQAVLRMYHFASLQPYAQALLRKQKTAQAFTLMRFV
jgi:hypothetical protein